MVNVLVEYFWIWFFMLDKIKYVINKIYIIIYVLKIWIFIFVVLVIKFKIEDCLKKGDL